MADFAEALGGYRVNELGSVVPLDDPVARMNEIRQRLANAPDTEGSLSWFLRRFLSIR
jgi:hypothetical protein